MRYRIPIIKLSIVRDSSISTEEKVRRSISHSKQAANICREMIGNEDREHFIVLHLDTKHKVVAVETVATGSLTAAIVHPREVYKAAIVSNSRAVILAHNHPSGDPTPSEEDHALTRRLKEAGELLGIPVLDHLVIGDDDRYYSFADEGML